MALRPGATIGPEELESLASLRPRVLLRRGPGKETFAWTSAVGLETIVKRYRGGPGLEGWRDRLMGLRARGPARREFEFLEELRALGLPVPRALGCHVSAEDPTLSLVVMERIDHREDLRQLLLRDPSQAGRWFDSVIEIVTGLHEAGWYHRDLYLDHFLVAENHGAAGQRLVLIDVQRARRERQPRGRWFVKDLAALAHSTPSGVGGRLQLRFLARWLDAHGARGRSARRRLLRAVRAKQRRMAAHEPRGGTSFTAALEEGR